MKERIGLALGGGGVPGVCVHAGFVDAIRERYDIAEIAGTSAGAIIAAAHALHPGECLKDMVMAYLADRPVVDGGAMHMLTQGSVYTNRHLRSILADIIDDGGFVHVPLTVVTANISTRQQSSWSHPVGPVTSCLPLRKQVLASAAVPVLLPPVVIDGDTHVDGGIVQNLPLDSLTLSKRIGAYFPDREPLEPGIAGYIDAIVGTIVNGNVLDEIDEAVNVDIVPLRKTGALLPERISADDAHHLCKSGYLLGRDYLRS